MHPSAYTDVHPATHDGKKETSNPITKPLLFPLTDRAIYHRTHKAGKRNELFHGAQEATLLLTENKSLH